MFESDDAQLVGILHSGSETASRGVVLIVGGPQYRVGSHRQFVRLARYLAERGIPVFRFDHSGIGDSWGDEKGFENIGNDIRASIDTLTNQLQNVSEVVLWGLCDAASAAMMYAPTDDRVRGLALLNPWARTESGQAQTIIKHYYAKRFFSREFWNKAFSGTFDARRSIRSFVSNLKKARQEKPVAQDGNAHYTERMLVGLERFGKPVLLVISGKDLTAAEFIDMTKGSRRWQSVLDDEMVEIRTISAADHTFSSDAFSKQVEQWTAQWIGEL